MDELFLRLARDFTVEADLPILKALALAWSGADLLLLVAALRLAAAARPGTGGGTMRVRWTVFVATAALTSLLPFVGRAIVLFYLDAAIALPQYAVLLHVLVADRAAICELLAARIARSGAAMGPAPGLTSAPPSPSPTPTSPS